MVSVSTFYELLRRDAVSIVERINQIERMHVLTFEILVTRTPNVFSVYHKNAGKKKQRLYSGEIIQSKRKKKVSDYAFFHNYNFPIKHFIVSNIVISDPSEFYCIQMVRDGWKPCGDFA